MVKTFLLRRDGMGNNCHHVADNYPGGMKIVTPEELPANAEVVLRWGTTTPIPNGPLIFNKAKAIHETYNKGVFRKKAADVGLAPHTWLSYDEYVADPYQDFEWAIVRPVHHQRGSDLHFCESLDEVKAACKKITKSGQEYYISEFINKWAEYRVFVVAGRIICVLDKVMPKRRQKEVAWGLAAAYNYVNWSEWPIAVCENAIKSFNLTKLDFAAIDIVLDDNDKAYFLEANTAPEVWPYYGGKLALAIKHHVDTNRDRIPVANDGKNWKDYIHPILSVKANV